MNPNIKFWCHSSKKDRSIWLPFCWRNCLQFDIYDSHKSMVLNIVTWQFKGAHLLSQASISYLSNLYGEPTWKSYRMGVIGKNKKSCLFCQICQILRYFSIKQQLHWIFFNSMGSEFSFWIPLPVTIWFSHNSHPYTPHKANDLV